jgi:DNA-binding CsgD family transcriptional regulator
MDEDSDLTLLRAAIRLSPRQVECLNLTALGLSSAEIAADLGISSRTVDQHIGDACVRLKVRRRVHAVACAIGLGLLKAVAQSAHSRPV